MTTPASRKGPFGGTCQPSRVSLLAPGSKRSTLPFPHPWNYQRPIDILEAFFCDADQLEGFGRHNRYVKLPGMDPVFVTRDPQMIRAITVNTGNKSGQFDRDTMPSTGIARATGEDTLLYANGELWKQQRQLAASPFGKTSLFQPEKFQEFEETFRRTISERIAFLERRLQELQQTSVEIPLEAEIKPVMLELLTNNFFSAEFDQQELRERFVPALERIIDHIVEDTIMQRLGWLSGLFRRRSTLSDDLAAFEELTTRVLAARRTKRGLWSQFRSEAPDELLRSNIKVFLAGALEATTSFASWTISHLARHPEVQKKVWEEICRVEHYTPDELNEAVYLGAVLDETLRLTPSLYFLPRRATVETAVQLSENQCCTLPKGTHVLLDVWHANRHDDHWGTAISGYPAEQFAPERWEFLAQQGTNSKDRLHFGFGHGPRVCPGKHLGLLEVGLVVGGVVQAFELSAQGENLPRAGVSTKPADGTRVKLTLRRPAVTT